MPNKMHSRQITLLTYTQSCGQTDNGSKHLRFNCLCQLVKDPILSVIISAVLIGSSCLLSGLILLCFVARTMNDQTSEAILLLGMGFFVSLVAYLTWKVTMRSSLDAIAENV